MHIATSGFANVQRLTHLKRERARSGESATVDKAEEEFLAKVRLFLIHRLGYLF